MHRPLPLRLTRAAASKTWLAAVLTAWLVLAQSFAVAHEYDDQRHANGQTCAVCVAAASFAAGNVAAAVHFEPTLAASFVAVAAGIVFLSVAPTHRYARGPPRASFAL